jgi:hypothetical protein
MNLFRFYSKPADSKIRVAVVGEYSKKVLKIAVARCSKKDSFIRKKGKAIAEGRLAKGKIHSSYKLEECPISMFIEIAKNVSEEVIHTKIIC